MPENQNIEYKSSWHDDWLKWICGFANASGGKLYIGKDDKGNAIGIDDSKKLMDDLPNKLRNYLGITSEVNLLEENDKYFIEIITQPQSVAISLRGRYYKRIGSINTELTGNNLNEFLLKKSGKTWDDVIEERATQNDIDEESIKRFINIAEKTNRLPDITGLTNFEILEKLRLTEGEKYKRAAIILFGKDPGKFYPSISVKIGKFGKSADELLYEEVEEGNLFKILQNVLNQLNRKFFRNPIDFEGMQRIEKGEYPIAAVREMLLNALAHKSYNGAAIQIRIYDDKINIWNEGTLPPELTLDSLTKQHPSIPRNPIIADVCYKGGFIDTWGRGTLKIINACKEAELPSPEIKEEFGGFSVTIFKDVLTDELLRKLGLNERQIKAVLYVKESGKITNKEYRDLNNISDEGARIDLNDLIEKNIFIAEGSGRSSHYLLNKLGD
ncbi:MAG: transcriptional regulator [Ignavibacteria bacterium RIFOXYB2_FULL_35_12]|nr:MAG: transcriptional regulator [Ignavibacteria bacterium GWC2_35_8]OGU60456.1 MAG: transcriptional regulator [Ignavibacteria bacterium GWF2_35_20]OGU84572.1 MAG: transcriptional regulator [Ignavibacteria bacterium RIFOXYA12_FULL_35_25]OGU96842.1 MAG: transcriptional regulator [Ignavibacteria bacterium RIFOXYB12_FULL_35_14]OGV01320.1 MAG: transcriptional regulator [Ignavibacteria bacterium RIFOXYC2_FULL_35_16]OGV05232.1 MAG: transcriptional regulator [Ignavibacteria bacterium RIFOXYB2_FULL_3